MGLCQRRHLQPHLQQIMSAIARLAVSPRLSMAAARSLRPATVQASQLLSTSAPKSDIDSAAKFIGAGAATVGVAGSGAGIGSVLCSLRGHGTLLSYDGFPPALRLLNTDCVECRHLAPEERLLFPSACCTQRNKLTFL